MSVHIERQLKEVSVLIDISESTTASLALAVGSSSFGSFQLPTMTGTAITVNYSNDGTNWTQVPTLSHESNPITTASNGTYYIPALAFFAKFIQFVSGSAEGADRTITVVMKG